MSVDEVLGSKLRQRELGADPRQKIWEHKTLNIHRGVLQWQVTAESPTLAELSASVRDQIAEAFHVSWWRGFGFGALIEIKSVPKDISTIGSTIDTRTNSKGTWQWTVLTFPETRLVVGTHTWMEGYLSSVYRGLIDHYKGLGFEVGSFAKGQDQLMRFLTTASSLRGFKLAEFEQ